MIENKNLIQFYITLKEKFLVAKLFKINMFAQQCVIIIPIKRFNMQIRI